MTLIFCKYTRFSITLALLLQTIVTVSLCSQHLNNHKLHDIRQPYTHQQKRQAVEDRVVDSSSWKKIVTLQKSGEEPVETKYSWSSSSDGSNIPDRNTQLLGETVRRIVTSTLTEENVIDNKPTSGLLEKTTKLEEPAESSNSERVSSYNITVIRTHGFGSGTPEVDQKPHICPQNHFGSVVTGCRKCNCNSNIDLTVENSCDPLTGKCLKCLYNTQGDHCDQCKLGYFGDAMKQQCSLCVCNSLGTNPKAEHCDSFSGQCSCLPNVTGLDCGKCKAGFFDFASGKGCEPCNCDLIGSISSSCNEYDGKCECHSNYGGQQCNECPIGLFGNPKVRCQACACNREGSVNQVCHSRSGKCRCLTGKGGDKCDRCARGFHGKFPNCEPCGECFDIWDKEVEKLKNQTQALLERVKLLLTIGTNGDYANEFNDIESKLNRIKYILDNQKLDEDALRELANHIDELGRVLKNLEKTLSEYEQEAESTVKRTQAVQDGLRDYSTVFDRINILISSLSGNASEFKESNIDGAYATILDSQNRSREAEKRVRDLKPLMLEQEQKRRATENLFPASRYNSSSLQNEAILASFSRQIYELENNIPGINQLVCASTSTVDTCDQLCGGALCNKCGGLSCSEGATTKANNALDFAQLAMDLLNQKYNQSKLDLDALTEAKNRSEEALKQAKLVMDDCELQKSKFDIIGNELNGIMDGVDKFSLMDGARPAEVRTLGNECLGLSISLKPEQILELAQRINETLSSLTNIDRILQETAGDLNTAEQLHQQADRAKEMADNILDTVKQVLNMLKLAAIEQARAAAAIAAATADIEEAQADLARISSETEYLLKIIAELTEVMKKLRNRLNELRKKYSQNELYVSQAKAAADDASKLADQAEKGADELQEKVRQAEEKLLNKAKQNGETKDRAERLKNDALQLAADILSRLDLLRELDDLFDEYVKRAKDYQDIVDDLHKQMNQYLKDIDSKAQYYRECQT